MRLFSSRLESSLYYMNYSWTVTDWMCSFLILRFLSRETRAEIVSEEHTIVPTSSRRAGATAVEAACAHAWPAEYDVNKTMPATRSEMIYWTMPYRCRNRRKAQLFSTTSHENPQGNKTLNQTTPCTNKFTWLEAHCSGDNKGKTKNHLVFS